MEERDYLISLYDVYGELFNDKQRSIFEEYYFEDKSLSEISDDNSKSRNAIHKCIKGINSKLYFYEEVLGVYRKNMQLLDLINFLEDSEVKKKLEDIYEE